MKDPAKEPSKEKTKTSDKILRPSSASPATAAQAAAGAAQGASPGASMDPAKTPDKPAPAGPQKSDWIVKTFFLIAVGGTLLGLIGGATLYWYFSRGLPKIIAISDYRPPIVTQIIGNKGEVLGEFFRERRYIVPYEKIPDVVVRAFISAEDDQFFTHPGVNIFSMVRASIANFRAGHVVQGGSTITQQVAKSLLGTAERTFGRKGKEVILASRIEKNLTKQQILYLYLNQIYLGSHAYGVQAAAKTYFHKDVWDISVPEAALLAGLPQAPGKYSPVTSPKKAKERQLYVLRRMAENGYITQAQMAEAASQQLKIFHDENSTPQHAAYLVEHIRQGLLERYGDKAIYEDGLVVHVPATLELADAATKSLRDGLRATDKRTGYRGPLLRLKDSEETEKFEAESRMAMIEKKLQFQILMPDGRSESQEAMRIAGLTSDDQLLDEGEIYRAVVTAVDDKKKMVSTMIGLTPASLSLEKMKWAHPDGARGEISIPSRAVKKGDVISVKIESKKDGDIQVSLEQAPLVQGALFSMEASTGNVLAMEGGFDYDISKFNRATQAQRQPGSAFKPIIYSAALEKGYTPASVIVDSPIVYEDADSGRWKPANFEEKFYGDTTFRQALIKSRNVPTIKIVQAIQVPYLINYAKRLGLNAQFNADLSISLGTLAVSLMDITQVYALFPRQGRKVTPIFVTRVLDRDGKVLEETLPQPLPAIPKVLGVNAPLPAPTAQPEPKASSLQTASPSAAPSPMVVIPPYPPADDPDQVLDPRVAYVMTSLMKEVVAFGTGYGAKALGRSAAGKTGTTSDYIDAWFLGFTPHVVTGVWVGNDNQKPIGTLETGARSALPIWLSYMKQAVKSYPETEFAIPPGVTFASIDPFSGKLAAPNASGAIQEAFIEGTQPTETAGQQRSTPEIQTDFYKEDTE